MLNLLGILDIVGAPRSAAMPTDLRRSVVARIGETLPIELILITSQGVAVPSDSSVTLKARKQLQGADILSVPLVQQDRDKTLWSATVAADVLKRQQPGRAVYEVWLTTGGGDLYSVVPLSELQLLPSLA